MTLRTLTLPLKVLASAFLLTIGVAYLFALAYLYLIDVEPHTKQGMGLVAAVILKYYGQRDVFDSDGYSLEAVYKSWQHRQA